MPQDNLTELKRRVPGGKYTLARAIAERARQLQSGESIPLVEVKTPNPLSVAIDEIVSGKISFRVSADPGEVTRDSLQNPTLAAENALDEVLGLSNEASAS
ncbi:DNA-directed RNA polymerase subunit omega [bacterium]|nr:MAG: DNA-directed RNA polymerase subunit omega [bacterium]